jgi:hypothetical protein
MSEKQEKILNCSFPSKINDRLFYVDPRLETRSAQNTGSLGDLREHLKNRRKSSPSIAFNCKKFST